MSDSSIYIIYADGKGNVTLSPRRGVGQVEPEYHRGENLTLLEGSGVTADRMVANVMCSNCERWDGGSTDFSSASGSWIYASRSGDPMESPDLDASIEEHNEDHAAFTWDYTSAKGGDSVNPFVAKQKTSGGSSSGNGGSNSGDGGVSSAPAPVSNPSQSGDSDDSSGTNTDMLVTAHGALAAITFLVLFPVGAALIRIPGMSVWFHAGVQIFSYCCFIAAAGIGIYLATTMDYLTKAHPVIGMVLLAVLFFQPMFGTLHHRAYKKQQGRTHVSYVHVWLGRLAVVLGMINGGLGIQLAGDVSMGYTIAYGVVAGVMGLVFVGIAVYGEMVASRRKATAYGEDGRRKERNGS